MTSYANLAVFSSLREARPTRRELALGARPSSLIEKRFALQPGSCADSLYFFPLRYTTMLPRYYAVLCKLYAWPMMVRLRRLVFSSILKALIIVSVITFPLSPFSARFALFAI